MRNDESADPLLGTILEERYRIEERIGRGGMGTVYRARQLRMERDVAIKVLRQDLPRSRTAKGRFERESRVASKLRHPNSIVTYDFGDSPAGLYLVMELLQGITLKDRLREVHTLHPLETAKVGAGIAASLAEAHDYGIVHRDLKPANVFLHQVYGLEVAKVLDFGIAKFVYDSARDGRFVTSGNMYETSVVDGPSGPLVGTACYMAPEYIIGNDLDGRADIYSLGAMLYEMLTGDPPFDHEDPETVLEMHVRRPPPPLPADIPEPLRVLVTVMLAKNPDRRPRDATEVMESLSRYAGDRPLPSVGDRKSSGVRRRNRVAETSAYEKGSGEQGEPEVSRTTTSMAKPERLSGDSLTDAWNRSRRRAGISRRTTAIAITVLLCVVLAALYAVLRKQQNESNAPPPPTESTLPGRAIVGIPNTNGVGVRSNPAAWRPIPAGDFEMGSGPDVTNRHPSETPAHRVRITRPYQIKSNEVTQSEWEQLMGTRPWSSADCGRNCPVESITWWEALAFCNALSVGEARTPCYELAGCAQGAQQGMTCESVRFAGPHCAGYRLPSEAEWEYAARAVPETSYKLGAKPAKQPHVAIPSPVGRDRANSWGLHGALGGVREWVWDVFDTNYYDNSPKRDPLGPEVGERRVHRGCSWHDPSYMCREAIRFHSPPGDRSPYVGLRPVITTY